MNKARQHRLSQFRTLAIFAIVSYATLSCVSAGYNEATGSVLFLTVFGGMMWGFYLLVNSAQSRCPRYGGGGDAGVPFPNDVPYYGGCDHHGGDCGHH